MNKASDVPLKRPRGKDAIPDAYQKAIRRRARMKKFMEGV